MAGKIEFEKLSDGSARSKWSGESTSRIVSSPSNVHVDASAGNISVKGLTFSHKFRRTDISTIDGVAAPATDEETIAAIAELYNGKEPI